MFSCEPVGSRLKWRLGGQGEEQRTKRSPSFLSGRERGDVEFFSVWVEREREILYTIRSIERGYTSTSTA
jgi:hypothetical protein